MDIERYRRQLTSIVNRKRALVFIGKVEEKRYMLTLSSFTGVRTLFHISKQEPITIHLEKEIDKGELELVFVAEEELVALKEGTNHLPAGSYRVRVLGEGATGRLSLY